jgi:hypothetical protein
MTDKLQASLSTSYKPMRITSMDEREAVMDFRYAKITPSAMIAAQMRRTSGASGVSDRRRYRKRAARRRPLERENRRAGPGGHHRKSRHSPRSTLRCMNFTAPER